MPIYEYKCDTCGNKFEKLIRSSNGAAELACPACGERHVTQQLSTFSPIAHSAPSSAGNPVCPRAGECGKSGACGFGPG